MHVRPGVLGGRVRACLRAGNCSWGQRRRLLGVSPARPFAPRCGGGGVEAWQPVRPADIRGAAELAFGVHRPSGGRASWPPTAGQLLPCCPDVGRDDESGIGRSTASERLTTGGPSRISLVIAAWAICHLIVADRHHSIYHYHSSSLIWIRGAISYCAVIPTKTAARRARDARGPPCARRHCALTGQLVAGCPRSVAPSLRVRRGRIRADRAWSASRATRYAELPCAAAGGRDEWRGRELEADRAQRVCGCTVDGVRALTCRAGGRNLPRRRRAARGRAAAL